MRCQQSMLRGIMLGTHQAHSVPTATQSQGTRKPTVCAHMRTAECPLGTPCSHRNSKPTHKDASNQCMKARAGCPPCPQYSHWNTRPRHQRSQPLAYICKRVGCPSGTHLNACTGTHMNQQPLHICTMLSAPAAHNVPTCTQGHGTEEQAISAHIHHIGYPPVLQCSHWNTKPRHKEASTQCTCA